MKISSYIINDIAYHYIGVRVLDGMAGQNTTRAEQIAAISRNAYKYVSDKALRLMLPEPRGRLMHDSPVRLNVVYKTGTQR